MHSCVDAVNPPLAAMPRMPRGWWGAAHKTAIAPGCSATGCDLGLEDRPLESGEVLVGKERPREREGDALLQDENHRSPTRAPRVGERWFSS